MTKAGHTSVSFRTDQRGLVSFIVTLLLMVVISLIVLGFARITRREQRQALDRQLSTAAFYAAEAGVNDARDHIKKTIATTGLASLTEKNDCNQLGSYNQQLSPTTSYTCLLINPFPTSLSFKPINKDASTIFPVAAQGGTVINSLTFYWQDSDGGTNLSGCRPSAIFPASWPANCNTGMLRLDLVPVNSLDRNNLIAGTMTAFFYPSTSGSGTVNEGLLRNVGNQGRIVEGKCDGSGPQQCFVTITGLTAATTYYARLRAVYDNSNVTVKASNVTVVGDLRLVGAQAIVDSTGKANDVVRRIQVNLPLVNTGIVPESVLDSIDTICKKFTITNTVQPDSTVYFKDACQLD